MARVWKEKRNVLVVELPWPHRDLSPNSRKHWSNRASKAKIARRAAFILTKERLAQIHLTIAQESKQLQIGLQFYPKDKRHYDLDNLIARMKASLDGIADALCVNDRKFGYSQITLEAAQKPGKVIVTISECPIVL